MVCLRQMQCRFGFFVVLSWVLAGAAGAPLSASGSATARAGSVELFLAVEADGTYVDRGGVRERITARSDVSWRTLQPLSDGWVAAGSRFASDGREELALVVKVGARAPRWLPQPDGERVTFRSWPVPFVTEGALVGAAWLEGDDPKGLAVRSATWSGEAWGDSATVAVPGAGTQTALSGAVLGDGRALLVWSAFDGTDDEILWSAGYAARWTEPQALHAPNSQPDVIPAVISTPGGTFAAWSRYDGNDYRLKVAAWGPAGWDEFDWSGERGSLFPSFTATDGAPRLLSVTTEPRGWSVVELRPGGVSREARLVPDADSPLHARPLLSARGDAPELVWPEVDDPESARSASGATETTGGARRRLSWQD